MIRTQEAEQSVVGGILCDASRVMPLAAEVVTPEDFYDTGSRTVYTACLRRFYNQEPIDAIALLAELGEAYKAFLLGVMQATISVTASIDHIPLVAENARRLRAIEKIRELELALQSGNTLDECQTLAALVAQGMTTMQSGVVDATKGFELVRSVAGAPRSYIETGFSTVDKYLRIAPGDFVIVAARPSAGKTALTLQMALHMAKRRKVAYFSCETKAVKLYERAVACFSRIELDSIKSGKLDTERMLSDKDAFSSLHFTAIESAGWSPAQIRAKTVQLGAEVIFIDYMTLLKGEGKSLYEKASSISIALHTMAQQASVTVIGLSQLNRAAQSREPNMADLRESGQFEQDADAILFIHRERDDSEHTGRKIILAKNKEGITGDIKFNFAGQYQRFAQVEQNRR